MTISAVARRAMYLPETAEVFLPLLKIESDELADPLYFVSNDVDITSSGQAYQSYPFNITLPPQDEETTTGTKIRIDNTDLAIMSAIRSISGKPQITLSIVLASSPDVLERGPMQFDLESVDYDAASIDGNLLFDSILDEPSPAFAFTPQYFPALFGGQ